MRHPWIWDLKLVHSNCCVRDPKCEPHTFSGWWTMEPIFPHEAALYGTSISGWCLGSSGGAGKRWWNVGMPRQLSGVEWLIPSVGCFLCSNLHGRRRNKFWLMYIDAVNWVVYQVLVAAFLGMLRLLLDMFVIFSDASEVTFMQASRILRRQL